LTALTIPTSRGGGGGGGVGGDRFDVREVGDVMGHGGIRRMHPLINKTTLLGENPTRTSFLSHEMEIRGLFSTPSVPW